MRRFIIATALLVVLVPPAALAGTAKTITLTTKLAGKNEVPKGAPAGKGTATITISGGKVCWKFTFSGIDKPTASHIHKAAAGAAGPVLVPLGAAFKAAGCTTAPASVIKGIVAHPSRYYVNIHTAKFPGGAIRGQL
jgi:hypothetical protein